MTTIEIENLSSAELKTKREELAEAIKGEADLAARYVQARFDAKQRDEKLAEQGKTITILQETCDQLKSMNAELVQRLNAATAAKDKAGQQLHDAQTQNAELKEQIKELQRKLAVIDVLREALK